MDDQSKLIETLQRIEALYAGATTRGEREAAANARERIRARLEKLQESDPPVEFRFTLNDLWSRKLFVALLRRYGIKPYRYARQRYTTVMAVVSTTFVDETLWPEYQKLNQTLQSYLADVTDRIISEGIFADNSEPEIRQKLLASA
ncbi:MAG TPA: hypothetical protein VMY42_00400 [Thermoguttaceae bacterium]|nr:hypothetical protein [Thermoguttaceae bacterium]